ncbi:MAG: FAD-dependent oxidoreductase [Gammaproteobacteria bacterium]|nr:FAD-dependent oxidoreductase [Gammaproteobacteria bacterium]
MSEIPTGSAPGADHDVLWRQLVAPADYVNPEPAPRYNLVVIGAGPGGLVTAIAAAGLGAKVALVERHAMGGDCLNVGCVPSKALLEITQRAGVSFDEAFAWLREVRAGIAAHDSVDRYTQAGVDVFLGEAGFTARDAVAVAGVTLHARRFVIATGARAAVPPIPGLADCEPLTNETLFDLTERPRRFAILGAGAIGCEMAQVFARLGTEVHVFEQRDQVLPLESPEAGEVLAQALQRDGVTLHLGAGVTQVSRVDGGLEIRAGSAPVQVDRVLVALGRRANTDGLNLAAAGVGIADNGLIEVDHRLRTTNPHIYAIGDVCSTRQFTHNADMHARAVVQNALFAPTARVDRAIVPHCTYTRPEVASVGCSAADLEADGTAFDRYQVRFGELDRGRAAGDTEGFAEVLVARGGDRILGATIVGHDAGEQIASLVLLMTQGLGLGAASRLVLPYPTRAEYLKRLGDACNRRRLTPRVAGLMRRWLKWRR